MRLSLSKRSSSEKKKNKVKQSNTTKVSHCTFEETKIKIHSSAPYFQHLIWKQLSCSWTPHCFPTTQYTQLLGRLLVALSHPIFSRSCFISCHSRSISDKGLSRNLVSIAVPLSKPRKFCLNTIFGLLQHISRSTEYIFDFKKSLYQKERKLIKISKRFLKKHNM